MVFRKKGTFKKAKKGKALKKKKIRNPWIVKRQYSPTKKKPSEAFQIKNNQIVGAGVIQHGNDASTMIKPEKRNQTSATIRPEEITCYFNLCDKADTCPPCVKSSIWRRKYKVDRFNMGTEEVGKKMEDGEAEAKLCIQRLANERDYFKAEYERLFNLSQKFSATEGKKTGVLYCMPCQKKDQMIEHLQRETQVLANEKSCLLSRLDRTPLDTDSPSGKCSKASCRRVQRERDLLKLDIHRLEEEMDCLREKLKIIGENKVREYAKFQEQQVESENIIKKLENEKRELMKAQGVRRVTINALEGKLDTYTNLLRVANEENHKVQMQYSQLKKLHEQCDSALLDTQAQLMEVETELLNCLKRKELSKYQTTIKRDVQVCTAECPCGIDAQVCTSKCPCGIDVASETEKSVSFASEDVKKNLKQLNRDKGDLVNELNKTNQSLLQCRKDVEMKDNQIVQLQQKINDLEEEINKFEEEKRYSGLDEAQNKALQAEVDHLKKETFALAASNHQYQTDSAQIKLQLSVALETVNELENRTKQLEEYIVEYERQIQSMKNDSHHSQTQLSKQEKELRDLLKTKDKLQNINDELNMENRACEKTICDLKCKCGKLEKDLNEFRSETNSWDKENSCLKKRINILENKLIQCICAICDNARDKSAFIDCLFKDSSDTKCQHGILLPNTREVGVQTLSETMRNSIEKGMARSPVEYEPFSEERSSQNIFPRFIERRCSCRKDSIISSMYQSMDSMNPFNYKPSSSDEKYIQKKSPLNIILEEMSTEVLDREAKIEHQEPYSLCGYSYEDTAYIIDNVKCVCKVVQVGTEKTIRRRKILGDETEISND